MHRIPSAKSISKKKRAVQVGMARNQSRSRVSGGRDMAEKDYGKFKLKGEAAMANQSRTRKLKNKDALKRKRAAYLKSIMLSGNSHAIGYYV
jgi:hypothetical protein